MHLSVITLGHVHSDPLNPLTPHFTRLEQVQTNLPARASFEQHRAELNRAIDAAAADWILILREREEIGAELAREIADSVSDSPRAWGYRIRTTPFYSGEPLRLGSDAGELRLFQRRHLTRRGELIVQGSVIRLSGSLRLETFPSPAEHRAYLEKTAVPHSWLRHRLLFARNVLATRARDRNTLRYLWIEAAFDSDH